MGFAVLGASLAHGAPFGENGQALDLPGPDGHVSVADAPELVPAGGLTIEAWVVLEPGVPGRPTIVRKDPAPFAESYNFRIEFGRPQFAVAGANGFHQLWPLDPVPAGVPTHLAATYDGSTSRIYVNGIEIASADHGSGPLVPSSGELRIGKGDDISSGETFRGEIDAVRLWDHPRSPTEIYGGVDRELPSGAGLIASWNFNGDLSDATGSHDGVAVGSTGFAAEFTGFARSAQFPTEGGWVEVPHAAELVPATGLTVEAWIEIEEYRSLATVVRKDPAGSGESYNLRVDTGRPYFAIQGSNGSVHGMIVFDPIPLDTPTHLAATYDGVSMTIYRDGVQIGQQPAPYGPLGDSSGPLRIGFGDDAGVSSNQFVGRIDGVRIWKMARTADDIAATPGREIPDLPGLIASYELNGDFTDSAGGHDGAVAGGAVAFGPQVGGTIGVSPGLPVVIGHPTGACPGPAEVVAFGLPYQGQSFGFGVVGAPPLTPGFLILGSTTLAAPIPVVGINLFVNPVGALFVVVPTPATNPLGQEHSDLTPAVNPAGVGLPLAVQYVFPNLCGPEPFRSSDALQSFIQH